MHIQVTGALQHANMKNIILRTATADSPLTRPAVARIWQAVTGNKMNTNHLNDAFNKFSENGDDLPYKILEDMMIADLASDRMLPTLSVK